MSAVEIKGCPSAEDPNQARLGDDDLRLHFFARPCAAWGECLNIGAFGIEVVADPLELLGMFLLVRISDGLEEVTLSPTKIRISETTAAASGRVTRPGEEGRWSLLGLWRSGDFSKKKRATSGSDVANLELASKCSSF
jgi:hypothetical protein